MKKFFCMLAVLAVMVVCLVGCGSNDYDSKANTDNDYSYSGGSYKDHNGDGEYGFSDYLKDQAPDLYDDIKDRYDSLK